MQPAAMIEPFDPSAIHGMLTGRDDVSPALVAMGRHLARVFAIRPDDAPGLKLTGALLDLPPAFALAHGGSGFSVTGNGMSAVDALVSCLGEAAEAWSQFEQDSDVVVRPDDAPMLQGWIGHLVGPMATCLDWVEAVNVVTGRPVQIPADLVWRRAPSARVLQPPAALSSGVAAGHSLEAATNRAILELIERDAAALWWLAGTRPRVVAPSTAGHDAVMEGLAAMRQGCTTRQTQLLDITTDLGVPVIAAVSTDRAGQGLAVGIAARLSFAAAASAALREMGQMELSAAIASAKRIESGEHALNEADRRHLARAAFAASSCTLLQPHRSSAAGMDHEAQGQTLLAVLAPYNLRICTIDLTRKGIGVPVVRAICPDLQPFCETAITPRMAKVWATNGGGRREHGGIMPF